MQAIKNNIVNKLQADILRLQGFKPHTNGRDTSGLDFMKSVFPNGVFPTGCMHEFITASSESAAASSGFIAGLVSGLMNSKGAAVWISPSRKIFPPALKLFGLDPERFIFINTESERDILWATDETLKCSGLSAVIAEVRSISFTESRRLQLAVEQSKVTGFLLQKSNNPGTTACVTRWQIEQVASMPFDELPGLSYPKWKVKLLRMRNGKVGEWNVEWKDRRFVSETYEPVFHHTIQKKTG